MEAWRVSNFPDLSGIGGLKASGRWHTRGKGVVYLADHPASALLELLVRIDPDLIPDTYTLLRVAIPDTIQITIVKPDALPEDWRDRQAVTRQLGDRWLDEGATPIMQVPSAIIPMALNMIVNPAHPTVNELRIVDVIPAAFDSRLFRLPEWRIPGRP